MRPLILLLFSFILSTQIFGQAENTVFSVVEQMPRFRPDRNKTSEEAEKDLLNFIATHTRYPGKAKRDDISGRVLVQFEISPKGKVQNAHIVKSVHPLLDKEALRVVKKLPGFSPGFQMGKPVPVSFTLPIAFKLED